MKVVRQIVTIIAVVCIIMANVALPASAVDPVSTATMANALAQAITAYGASHGVSMTFDVANTNGIGEGMHELWNDFKTYIHDNNVPTYNSLANTMWATIYTKIGNFVGININDTEMPYIDAFWNWLLSGPAEMTKIDNQYYEWSLNQQGTVDPIIVIQLSDFTNQPFPVNSSIVSGTSVNNPSVATDIITNGYLLGGTLFSGSQWLYYSSSSVSPVYSFRVGTTIYLVSTTTSIAGTAVTISGSNDGRYKGSTLSASYSGSPVLRYTTFSFINNDGSYSMKEYPDIDSGMSAIRSLLSGELSSDSLSVVPYVGDIAPQDVYIPDNEDVNYAPLPYVGGLDIPWDDSIFGDGTDTLTDAQSEAISGVIDDSIVDSLEKTLTLADTENPDVPAPNEVYIPFLPVALPNFNFSLSGIWHYVREWISSLGAWFTMVLTVWSNLPYAMVVPVYATMVVLIVLGVYKRFFM